MSFLGRVTALRYQPRGPLPAVTSPPINEFTVAIGPVNYSNQATMWAQALRQKYSNVSTATFAVEVSGGFDFPSDVIVPVPFYQRSRHWQKAQSQALAKFTHILVEAEEPLLGRYFGRSLQREYEFFSSRGVQLAYMAHGTDIRIPQVHAERTLWSPYRDKNVYFERVRRQAERNIAYLKSCQTPLFVSTPDLLLDLPEAHWCPVVVDIEKWGMTAKSREKHQKLTLVHVPSVATIKGTHLIEPILRGLHARGLISYIPIQGVPAAEMPAVISSADIVLDQFRLGSYGVAACEAMAGGKAVIGHIVPEVRQIVVETTGLELPIVEATPETLEDIILNLAQNPAQLLQIQRDSQKFARAVHGGGASAEVLMNNWLRTPQHRKGLEGN